MIAILASTLVIGSDLHCDHDFKATCDMCRLRSLCLPAALRSDEIEALEQIIEYRRIFPAKSQIYRDKQKFTALFAVISGAVKTYKTYSDGKISITGCHLPGELFGFSGVNQAHYSTNARALEHTCICEIPFDELERVCRKVPGLQSQLMHLMSHRIVDYQEHLTQLTNRNKAKNRLAAFLLGLASRSVQRGESGKQIRLPMSGNDISNYLGISVETVSREFTGLARSGVIAKSNRDITILDIDRVRDSVCDISAH